MGRDAMAVSVGVKLTHVARVKVDEPGKDGDF
jgi:hypothetical protein